MKWIRWTMVLLVAVIVVSAAAAFYFVFMGGRTIPMPAVEGMTSASAAESLQKLGLVVREDHVVSQLPSGTVVSQWPVPGEKVAGGRLVILKVSRSGEKKPLPDVRGLEFNEASARLAKAGLRWETGEGRETPSRRGVFPEPWHRHGEGRHGIDSASGEGKDGGRGVHISANKRRGLWSVIVPHA